MIEALRINVSNKNGYTIQNKCKLFFFFTHFFSHQVFALSEIINIYEKIQNSKDLLTEKDKEILNNWFEQENFQINDNLAIIQSSLEQLIDNSLLTFIKKAPDFIKKNECMSKYQHGTNILKNILRKSNKRLINVCNLFNKTNSDELALAICLALKKCKKKKRFIIKKLKYI